jgi:hypothetical protein
VLAFGSWPLSQGSASLFDPATRTWSPGGGLLDCREDASFAPLNDGRFLVSGGSCLSGPVATAEVYDPSTRTSIPTGDMTIAREGHTSTRLPDGKVLITGGLTGGDWQYESGTPTDSAELYDPSTGSFTSTGSMAQARGGPSRGAHRHTATSLEDGRVLIMGGRAPGAGDTRYEVYDWVTGAFSSLAVRDDLSGDGASVTLLPSGEVLIVGGATNFAAHLYDPVTGRHVPAGTLDQPRTYPGATPLEDGTVLITGGVDEFTGFGTGYAEVWRSRP